MNVWLIVICPHQSALNTKRPPRHDPALLGLNSEEAFEGGGDPYVPATTTDERHERSEAAIRTGVRSG